MKPIIYYFLNSLQRQVAKFKKNFHILFIKIKTINGRYLVQDAEVISIYQINFLSICQSSNLRMLDGP